MADNIQGLQELLKSMESLPLTLQKRLIARALRKAAEPIRARAAAAAPDDPNTPGSRIRESMSIRITEQTATGAVAIIGPTKHGYAGIFAERGSKHQKAKPFLAPAFEDTVESAYKILEETLGDSIEEEFYK